MADENTETEGTESNEKTLPQSQVNDLVAREKTKAAEAARKELLKQIGVDDPEAIKEMVGGFKQWQDSQKSAEERAAALTAERDELVAYKANTAKTIQSFMDSAIAEVPEAKRSLIPDYDEPQKVLDWIAKNREVLIGKPAPANAGGGGSPALGDGSVSSGVTYDEWLAMKPEARVTFAAEHEAENTKYRARLRS